MSPGSRAERAAEALETPATARADSHYLDAEVTVRRPEHTLAAQLRASAGEVVAVIGPNGAGKTTLVRALAGLVPLDAGTVTVDGVTWTGPGVRLPVQRRRLGMAFSEDLLFPHLSAAENVAYGPRSRGTPRGRARAAAQGWLERFGVGPLADRRPGELSGGQAQRVSLARALAADPALLLLDEPMSALDVGVAAALRVELAEHLAGFGGVTVLVTHEALDALTLAHRVVVLDEGSVAQTGTPAEVSRRPRTDHVARLVGLNVLRGEAGPGEVRLENGHRLVATGEHTGGVLAGFAPSSVVLTPEEPVGSARNRWPGTVRSLAPYGGAVRVHVDLEPVAYRAEARRTGVIADVTPGASADLGLVPGRDVWVSVKATEVSVYLARE